MDEENETVATKSSKKKSASVNLKSTLNKLKDKDPDFYQFLQQQDADVLNFDGSEKENEDEDDVDSVTDEESEYEEPDTDNELVTVDEAEESKRLNQNKRQKYSKSLEEALKDSENEDEEEDDVSLKPISIKLLKSWEVKLKESGLNLQVIKQLILAFRAVIQKSGCDVSNSDYQINNPADCDVILNLCFDYFPKVWRQTSFEKGSAPKLKSKLLKPIVKDYVCDIIKFLTEIQDKALLISILKHIKNIAEYCALFPRKSKLLMKALIKIWGSQSNKCKLFTFRCMQKLVKKLKDDLFIFTLKRMYLTYSQSTILRVSDSQTNEKMDYMQKSFAELCQLDFESTYQNSFLYIRQLAIHLRNSIVTKKKETFKMVYSRHFTNLLYLWSVVLSRCRKNENLKQLIYPLIQVIIGSCRNAPSTKYLPFRLHCIRCLLILTKDSSIFVPVFSLLIEVLNSLNVGKQNFQRRNAAMSTSSSKPVNLDAIVKLSKSQLDDQTTFKPLIVERVFDMTIEALEKICGSPAFTELAFLFALQLKQFCKDTKSNSSFHQIRQLARKIEEHSKWIENYKARFSICLTDDDGLLSFETNCLADSNNVLKKYCESCKKLKDRQSMIGKKAESHLEKNVESKKRKKSAQFAVIANKKAKLTEKIKISNQETPKSVDLAPDIIKDFDMSELE